MAVAEARDDNLVVYDVVLLAGSPRRYTLELTRELNEGSVIEADGERWTIADLRITDGAPTQLICIYAD